MEHGLLWLIWQGIVVRAREYHRLKIASVEADAAYKLLMEEEDKAVRVTTVVLSALKRCGLRSLPLSRCYFYSCMLFGTSMVFCSRVVHTFCCR